jgi:hypothetical protein
MDGSSRSIRGVSGFLLSDSSKRGYGSFTIGSSVTGWREI